MPERLPANGSPGEDDSTDVLPLIRPPSPAEGEALWRWLAFVTPQAAPVLYGNVCPLPLTGADVPPRIEVYGHVETTPQWVIGRLRACPVSPRLSADAARLVGDLVVHPPCDKHGVPRYTRMFLVGSTSADEARARRNWGRATRAVSSAVMRDLMGMSFEQIAEKAGSAEALPQSKGGTRRTSELTRDGRHLLHALGAWPWAHAGRGQLPRDWWRRGDFLLPLSLWHRQSWLLARLAALESLPPHAHAKVDAIARGETGDTLLEDFLPLLDEWNRAVDTGVYAASGTDEQVARGLATHLAAARR